MRERATDGVPTSPGAWWGGLWTAWPRRLVVIAALSAAWGIGGVLVMPGSVVAQDADLAVEGDEEQPAQKSYLGFLVEALGLKYVVIFLVLSFGLVALLVMCFMQFRSAVILPPTLIEQVEARLNGKQYEEAYELVKNDESYLGRVLAAGMGKLKRGYPAAVEAMQAAGSEEAMNLEHKISYISLVGALAPMFGLLGTVDGMVTAFMLIAQRDTAPKPSELAVGISQALVTTLIGLWLAIPAIACYGLFRNWLQRFNAEVDDEALRIMARFQESGRK